MPAGTAFLAEGIASDSANLLTEPTVLVGKPSPEPEDEPTVLVGKPSPEPEDEPIEEAEPIVEEHES